MTRNQTYYHKSEITAWSTIVDLYIRFAQYFPWYHRFKPVIVIFEFMFVWMSVSYSVRLTYRSPRCQTNVLCFTAKPKLLRLQHEDTEQKLFACVCTVVANARMLLGTKLWGQSLSGRAVTAVVNCTRKGSGLTWPPPSAVAAFAELRDFIRHFDASILRFVSIAARGTCSRLRTRPTTAIDRTTSVTCSCVTLFELHSHISGSVIAECQLRRRFSNPWVIHVASLCLHRLTGLDKTLHVLCKTKGNWTFQHWYENP